MEKKYVLFYVLIILLYSCNNDSNPVNPEVNLNEVITPLKIGDSWTYVDSLFYPDGTFYKTDISQLEITGKETINYNGTEEEVFHWGWANLSTNKSNEWKWLVNNDENGLNFYGGTYLNNTFVLGKTLNIKYPVSTGDSWNTEKYSFSDNESNFYISDTVVVTCISTNEKIKTEEGEFNCYVYNYKQTILNKTYHIFLYYSKNIGYVGSLRKYDGEILHKKILSSKKLNKTKKLENKPMKQYNSTFGII